MMQHWESLVLRQAPLMSGGNVYGKLEGYIMGRKSLGTEYGTEVGSSTVLSDGSVESKIDESSGVFEKFASGKVVMGAGLLTVGADTMAVAEAAACYSVLRR